MFLQEPRRDKPNTSSRENVYSWGELRKKPIAVWLLSPLSSCRLALLSIFYTRISMYIAGFWGHIRLFVMTESRKGQNVDFFVSWDLVEKPKCLPYCWPDVSCDAQFCCFIIQRRQRRGDLSIVLLICLKKAGRDAGVIKSCVCTKNYISFSEQQLWFTSCGSGQICWHYLYVCVYWTVSEWMCVLDGNVEDTVRRSRWNVYSALRDFSAQTSFRSLDVSLFVSFPSCFSLVSFYLPPDLFLLFSPPVVTFRRSLLFPSLLSFLLSPLSPPLLSRRHYQIIRLVCGSSSSYLIFHVTLHVRAWGKIASLAAPN